MDFKQLFTWYFWAEKPVPMQESTIQLLLIIFGCVVLIGIGLHFYAQKKGIGGLRKAQVKAFVKPTIMFGLLELVFAWFHFEQVPLFSARIWFLFILLASITWLAHRARLAYIIYPKKYGTPSASSSGEREKYLPKQHNA